MKPTFLELPQKQRHGNMKHHLHNYVLCAPALGSQGGDVLYGLLPQETELCHGLSRHQGAFELSQN